MALNVNGQSVSDMLRLSQYDYSMSTARSAAMGGAFTSLGADLSSMSINPAGLGMYQSSDAAGTFNLSVTSMDSEYSGSSTMRNSTKFSMNNLGVALNVFRDSGSVRSVTVGIGYNKLADFNSTQSFSGTTGLSSITEVFAEQISGVSQSTLNKGSYNPYYYTDSDQWGGVLAWQTGVLDPATDSNGNEYSSLYTPFFNLDPDAEVYNSLKNVTKGYIGEYTLSVGANIDNILYVGATLGIQDIVYESTSYYDESYSTYDSQYKLEGIIYDRSSKIVGTGANIKIGAVINPVSLLRIGIAYHSPTWISINSENIDYMGAVYYGSSYEGTIDTPYLLNEYNIATPSRLLAGASLTIPNVGLISFDYERVWYNSMRLSYGDDLYYDEEMTEYIKELFAPANNFRAGIEITPTSNISIRAGYAYYGNCFSYDDIISANGYPDCNSWTSISAGLGYRFGSTYVDLTYVLSTYNYNDTDIFYYDYGDGVIESGTFATAQTTNSVMLTMGTRF